MNIVTTLYQNCSKENQEIINLFFNDLDRGCDGDSLSKKYEMEKTNPFFPFLYQKELKENNFSFMMNEYREGFFILDIAVDVNHTLKIELYLKSISQPSAVICNFVHSDFKNTYNPPHNCNGGLITYYEYSTRKKEWKFQQITNGLSDKTKQELKIISIDTLDLDNVILMNNFLENFAEPEQMLNGILLDSDIDISKSYLFNKAYQYSKLFV